MLFRSGLCNARQAILYEVDYPWVARAIRGWPGSATGPEQIGRFVPGSLPAGGDSASTAAGSTVHLRFAPIGMCTNRPAFASLFWALEPKLKTIGLPTVIRPKPRSLRIGPAPLALLRSEKFGWLTGKTSG